MAQRRKGERVLGPYPIGRQWRVIVVGAGGERDSRFYPTQEQAKQVARAIRREFDRSPEKTVSEALDAYELFLVHEKGNKPRSAGDTSYRLRLFFPDGELGLQSLTPERCAGYYSALCLRKSRTGRVFSVDSHRNILAEAKSFLRWCQRKKRWLRGNPLEGVDGVGKRKHGKPQLRIDEARSWMATAGARAGAGEAGAVAAMMALVMGMRASEIVSRQVRDLDDGGRLLWIPSAKTEAGRRTLVVPEVLRGYLRDVVRGKGGEARIFGQHWRDWVRKWVQRICREAGVPKVTAHGMRGLHSTLALEHGASAQVVAASLGHVSPSTTIQSYAKPEAVAGARQRRVLGALEGTEAS